MARERRIGRQEIALAKAMLATGKFPKDQIQAYFSRPDRTINYGRIADIESGKLGADVEPATTEELDTFVANHGKIAFHEKADSDPLSPKTLLTIFKLNVQQPDRLARDENDIFEAKETFHIKGGQFAKYAKTAAGFANAGGGYLVFGVKDETLEILGLADDRFVRADKADITLRFNQYLSPAIQWDRTIFEIANKKIGVVYVYSSVRKPVVSRVEADGLRDGAIYYRYVGSTGEARSAELSEILLARDRRAGEDLAQVVARVSNIGVQNLGIFDVDAGHVEGAHGSFLIDENLLPKLRFVKEGDFSEREGAPALRLIGDVEPVEVGKVQQPVFVGGRAISEYEIVRDFAEQNIRGDPKQYVRHQLHIQYKLLPVFYFAYAVGFGLAELTALVNSELHASKHTVGKICARIEGVQKVPAESRKNNEENVAKLVAKELPRVTPENATKLARAMRALRLDEIEDSNPFAVLRSLLVAYEETFDQALFTQLRLSASFIDEALFRPKLLKPA